MPMVVPSVARPLTLPGRSPVFATPESSTGWDQAGLDHWVAWETGSQDTPAVCLQPEKCPAQKGVGL